MRKRLLIFIHLCIILAFCPSIKTLAFEHVYERRTEEIYATVRYSLMVYDSVEGDFLTYVSEFEGIKAWKEEPEWYRIEYVKDGETRTGWITKGDFYSDCLIYDGREKQILADGEYQMAFSENSRKYNASVLEQDLTVIDRFHCTFTFLGDGLFTIMNTLTGQYLQPDPLFNTVPRDFWGPEKTAGAFRLTRKGNYFSIRDSVTNRSLVKDHNGIICYTRHKTSCWRLTRYNKAIYKDSVRVFAQFDADWADYYYGSGRNEDPSTNLFTTSGCGIFSTVNAIYAVTGMFPDPYELARYAVKKDYRILDNGTDSGFFKAAAGEFGKKYGFSYDGSSGSIDRLKQKIRRGDVAISHVPGHYVAIVSYDKKRKKFLLLDPYHLYKRATNAYGDWISLSDLEDGNLMGYEFYFYKPERPKD